MNLFRQSATLLLIALLISTAVACKKKGPVSSNDEVKTYEVPLEAIRFDFDKYNIRSDAQSVLQKHSQWIKENNGVKVIIQGHTDSRGTEEYNMALGERRANAAKTYLMNLGISPDQLSTISYGEAKPADSAENESAWAQNRRDEFIGRK